MLSKKVVVILVVIALILAAVSFSSNFIFNKKVSTDNGVGSEGQGKIGIEILPPAVEDKGLNQGKP
jgi:hypothetical protein